MGTGAPGPVKAPHLTAELISDSGTINPGGLAPWKTCDFLVSLWKEFDAGESYEACFAKAIDRSMPVLLNLNNNGGSWGENGVSYERVVKRVQPEIEGGCPELWEYLTPQLEAGRHKGSFAASAL
ncbi:HD domain-containing protein [Acidicapsa acidisoli]|uniref:HD domain-containing protein n=1 Tax=Acidicapsa acidisoli TaxID=1615681 RepID=UPI0021E0CB8D|nr:HD domain-containing protein [Acidicapsa acidisoli]